MITLTIPLSDCQIHFSRSVKANIVIITLPITVSDCKIICSRPGKANIVMITLSITVADCQILIACFIYLVIIPFYVITVFSLMLFFQLHVI